MTIQEIIENYLKASEFDGLFNYEIGCACVPGDPAPCHPDGPYLDCAAGVEVPDPSGEYDFRIVPRPTT